MPAQGRGCHRGRLLRDTGPIASLPQRAVGGPVQPRTRSGSKQKRSADARMTAATAGTHATRESARRRLRSPIAGGATSHLRRRETAPPSGASLHGTHPHRLIRSCHPRRRGLPGYAAPRPAMLNTRWAPRVRPTPGNTRSSRSASGDCLVPRETAPRAPAVLGQRPSTVLGQRQGARTWSPSQIVSQSRLDPVIPSDSEDPRRATHPVIASAPDMALGTVFHVEPPAHPTGGCSGDAQGEPALFHVKRTPPVGLWPRPEDAS